MRKSNEKSAVTATTGGKKNHLAAEKSINTEDSI